MSQTKLGTSGIPAHGYSQPSPRDRGSRASSGLGKELRMFTSLKALDSTMRVAAGSSVSRERCLNPGSPQSFSNPVNPLACGENKADNFQRQPVRRMQQE